MIKLRKGEQYYAREVRTNMGTCAVWKVYALSTNTRVLTIVPTPSNSVEFNTPPKRDVLSDEKRLAHGHGSSHRYLEWNC